MTTTSTPAELAERLAELEAENARLRAGPGRDGPLVKLGPTQVRLVCPKSLGQRWHVVINMSRRGREEPTAWAALGLCWPDYQRRHPYLGDLMTFGLEVCDALLAEGVPLDELQEAGVTAYHLIAQGLAPVEQAPDFSGTRAGGSASGDESSASSS